MHHPTDKITHTTAFVTPVVEHWLEREIAQWRDLLIYLCTINLVVCIFIYFCIQKCVCVCVCVCVFAHRECHS